MEGQKKYKMGLKSLDQHKRNPLENVWERKGNCKCNYQGECLESDPMPKHDIPGP